MGEWQTLVNIGVTAVLGWIGYFIKQQLANIRSIENELAAFKTEVAEKYATKPALDRIDSKLDRILERLPPVKL